ncbi:MAG: hypothetical protein INR71_04810 [Terriglobus roseus]|nr:hypothetical protein [Terriglobus roseus]
MIPLVVANGANRELEDWEALFKEAGGFDFRGCKPMENLDVVFVEAVRCFD